MCMQQPARMVRVENGRGTKGMANAFWESTTERRREHVRDLARHRLWMGVVEYARENRDTVFTALAVLTKARGEIVQLRDFDRVYCRDADRIFRFVAEESTLPEIGKRAVADIVLMGDAGGERVFKGELLSGIAIGARRPEVAGYALEQMAALGMKQEIGWVAEASVGMSHTGTGRHAKELFAKMEASDLHASGHGC
ncbi:MAG: hypothetical protein PHY95_03905 [Candidatus ainarchaeum sp.]|nr:hypothetical protein [Candidatus ainarchaeum sp.]